MYMYRAGLQIDIICHFCHLGFFVPSRVIRNDPTRHYKVVGGNPEISFCHRFVILYDIMTKTMTNRSKIATKYRAAKYRVLFFRVLI